MKATINNSVSELNYLLSNASKLLTFDIDCSTMPEKEVFHDRSILRCNNYLGDMFSILDTITMNPAIYWFEATNRNNAQLFLQALTAYRNSTKRLEEYRFYREGAIITKQYTVSIQNR